MCGPLEVPVTGSPQRDDFCRPLFTPPWELRKLRSCVCKRRYLRNSWGECIPRVKCIPCKFRWQRDYRMCAPGCPATCNKPFSASCNLPCSAGCVCPPGWVVHPKNSKMCIKAYMCLPKCPPNSSFQACVSSCLPKCGQNPPRKCDLSCERGACVCNKGYIELERDGKKTCVLKTLCLWHARTTPLFQPNATTYTGGTETSPTTTNLAGGATTHTEHADLPIAPVPSNDARTHWEGTPSSGHPGYSGGASSAGTEGALPAVTVPERLVGSEGTRSFGGGGNIPAGTVNGYRRHSSSYRRRGGCIQCSRCGLYWKRNVSLGQRKNKLTRCNPKR
ncbi:zonadhesin-like [Dermacentor silvarum]|uniref:zonadhesin-like n=1 Tax=Dermacentor silvarum TaxID=543639 RepID=UPI00189AD6EA|nr:zonadhesin-like [Dermacentor silvarum]